mmetsp:Transcript_45488/g.126564  ORF Transcript_45488/g.126564 Transcript_45488/m.126564 type:complete len:479 (-) Transcript_45488:389-1825(-)
MGHSGAVLRRRVRAAHLRRARLRGRRVLPVAGGPRSGDLEGLGHVVRVGPLRGEVLGQQHQQRSRGRLRRLPGPWLHHGADASGDPRHAGQRRGLLGPAARSALHGRGGGEYGEGREIAGVHRGVRWLVCGPAAGQQAPREAAPTRLHVPAGGVQPAAVARGPDRRPRVRPLAHSVLRFRPEDVRADRGSAGGDLPRPGPSDLAHVFLYGLPFGPDLRLQHDAEAVAAWVHDANAGGHHLHLAGQSEFVLHRARCCDPPSACSGGVPHPAAGALLDQVPAREHAHLVAGLRRGLSRAVAVAAPAEHAARPADREAAPVPRAVTVALADQDCGRDVADRPARLEGADADRIRGPQGLTERLRGHRSDHRGFPARHSAVAPGAHQHRRGRMGGGLRGGEGLEAGLCRSLGLPAAPEPDHCLLRVADAVVLRGQGPGEVLASPGRARCGGTCREPAEHGNPGELRQPKAHHAPAPRRGLRP